jgi:hypothetical protein
MTKSKCSTSTRHTPNVLVDASEDDEDNEEKGSRGDFDMVDVSS